MTPIQLAEAQRLHAAGFKLCELHPLSKQPVGDGWNNKPVDRVRLDAGGYGLMLALNGLCSIDPDDEPLAIAGLARCGFSLDEIRDAGVHTSSTRPGSGGRVTFRAPLGSNLRWLKFSSKVHGTILELRASSANLQDSLPGTVYKSADGTGPWVQDYAGIFTMEMAPELSGPLLAWWERMSGDVDFLREQQVLLVGDDAQLAVSSGSGSLAFASGYRGRFNDTHDVAEMLLQHGYKLGRNGRYAPVTATGAASVRPIPGKDRLWQSDHASDPLHGTFDAWTAHVVLNHSANLVLAEMEEENRYALSALDGFDDVPGAVLPRLVVDARRLGGDTPTRAIALPEPEDLPAFDRDSKGKIFPVVLNLLKAMRREDILGARIGFDRFRDELMIAKIGSDEWRPFNDADYVYLQATLETGGNGFHEIAKQKLRDVVHAVAMENAFDSAVMWLDGLQDDGGSRCETFLIDHFGVADTPYHRAVGLYIWTALAGRVLEPGIKADMAPVLVGVQGLQKSTVISSLVPSDDFFSEVYFSESEDNQARKMRGKLVAELAELRGLHTKDAEGIKAFMTRRYEEWVPKYKEFTSKFPRRLLFIGTTNETKFLSDSGGEHRRWLPIMIERLIDVAAVRRLSPLLWAEGARLFKANGIMWQAAQALAKAEHADFEITDDWCEPVGNWLIEPDLFGDGEGEPRPMVTTHQVLTEALKLEIGKCGRREELRAANVLRSCGYERRKVKIEGSSRWAFVPLPKK